MEEAVAQQRRPASRCGGKPEYSEILRSSGAAETERPLDLLLFRQPWTAKTLRDKGRIDCTSGVSREQRAINRRNKESSLLQMGGDGPKRLIDRKKCSSPFELEMRKYQESRVAVANREKNLRDIEEKRFGEVLYAGEVFAFEEQPFGYTVEPGQLTYITSANVVRDLSSIVVAIALFDGDTKLFACSGIPLPRGRSRLHLTRFVTSAHLVREFKRYRNKDDKMRVSVTLPDGSTTDGFLGLYDDDIAIVTCLGPLLSVCPIDLDFKATPAAPASPGDSLRAAGRAYKSRNLMAMHGSRWTVCDNTWVPDSQQVSKAVFGGPLLTDARFLGMTYDIYYDHYNDIMICNFLPLELLCERLNHFGILNPKQLDFSKFSLPEGISSVIPSGFMKTIYRLKSFGYPMPPPLVLEFNGQLLHRFEERFGDLLAWKGYPYGQPTSFSSECVWERLPKKVVKDISRCVVSLASFKGYVRSFACTGLLIKWHGSKATRTVILTSASLVRTNEDDVDKTLDDIDKTLTIEVFLPPNQRKSGTLEFYNLNYNVAIISVKKNFNAVHTEDIFSEIVQKPSKKVVAIGRDTMFGPLMATIGEVKRSNKGSKVVCRGHQVSTCKIKKSGTGGPLINFDDGSFVGMNFYDGSGVTPFLPKRKIAQVLRRVINSPLPSESEYDPPVPIDVSGGTKESRWPVPKPYWYHGELDVDRCHVPSNLPGRCLNS